MTSKPYARAPIQYSPQDKRWRLIPHYMRGGLDHWILYGTIPGDFLSAVLRNNLLGAVGHADDVNIERLRDYVEFLYNFAPAGCYGSPEAFDQWAAMGGIMGAGRRKEDADVGRVD
jgi:hypothetical protein